MKCRLALTLIAAPLLFGGTQAFALDESYTKPSAAKAAYNAEYQSYSPTFPIEYWASTIVPGYEAWRTQVQNSAVSYATTSTYDPATKTLKGSYSEANYNAYLQTNSIYISPEIATNTKTTSISYTNPQYSQFTGTTATVSSWITFAVNALSGKATYSVWKGGSFSQSNTVTVDADEGVYKWVEGLTVPTTSTASGNVAQTFTKFAASPYKDSSVKAVPGPEAGAGFAALAAGGIAFLLKRRRQSAVQEA